MQNGADIGAVFERLCRASAILSSAEKFAYNDHLGFITSCPTNCGTGLRASVHIQLPNLGKVR
jgi:protein-arginine kinase